jgi:hypothetical protein
MNIINIYISQVCCSGRLTSRTYQIAATMNIINMYIVIGEVLAWLLLGDYLGVDREVLALRPQEGLHELRLTPASWSSLVVGFTTPAKGECMAAIV